MPQGEIVVVNLKLVKNGVYREVHPTTVQHMALMIMVPCGTAKWVANGAASGWHVGQPVGGMGGAMVMLRCHDGAMVMLWCHHGAQMVP